MENPPAGVLLDREVVQSSPPKTFPGPARRNSFMGYRSLIQSSITTARTGPVAMKSVTRTPHTKHTQPLLESKEPKENIPHSDSLLMIPQGLTSILMSTEAI